MGLGWHFYVAVALTTACGFEVDFSGARFACASSADCPAGDVCAAGYCESPAPASGDAAPGESARRVDAAPTGEELVFRPIADATVDSAEPELNLGASDELRVDGLPAVRSYIRFDKAELNNIDERYRIESARLEVFARSAHPTGYQVSIVEGQGWIETSVTFVDAPVPGELVGTSGPVDAGTWTAVDLAAVMQEGDYESFALSTQDGDALRLASREDDDHGPRLVLAIDPP